MHYFHVSVVVKKVCQATFIVLAAVGLAFLVARGGQLTFNPAFKFIGVVLFALVLTASVMSNAVVGIAVGPDWMKALFVGFVNPVVWEIVFITPARFLARTLWHNDASTSFIIVPLFVFGKQYMGRSIAALVDSPSVLVVLSALNCIWEVLLRVSLRCRDRCLYQWVFSSQLPPGKDAAAMLSYDRNRRMRALNSMSESIGEIVATWNGVAMIILLDVSVDGESPMNPWKAVQAGFVQSAFELLTDVVSVLLLSYFGIHILDLAGRRYWYWSAALACPVLAMSSFGLRALFSKALCHDPGFREATFVVCRRL
ncbi:unnamed protein product [Prorocentrum cordatum]|uniref:Solute carrier family 40 protein n=1 Tax=Prorocentrum cordatum TaxID=2364126 RepID=A0ABN9TS25_9DINO|nr:unnamed protein product [Polarella glacialis]